MCGIAGFIDAQCSTEKAGQIIEHMCTVIRHRGPDDQGYWLGSGIALGMRRLSIIDVAGGHQPIFNEDQSILVVLNGEIYNYRDLHRTLLQRGHQFRTNSDTEVIVHAYEEYGDECVKHLRGMFAFALWDKARQRLLVARDRFGKKPLNYYWDGQRLFFASEIKSLLVAGVPRQLNPIALDEYLVYGYAPAPNTFFKGVMKLPAAHLLIYQDGQISVQRYWELSFTPTCHDDESAAIERTRALLQDAVQVRLMSEVPLGAFLSGGLDSSLVVGLMSQMMSQPVKTFSIGFEEDDFSEVQYARQVAHYFGTEHHEFLVKPDLISVLPQLAWAYDEPFADSSMLPTHYVSKLAREYVTVVLTGDGGDEIFGGYTRYEDELSIHRLPTLLRFLIHYSSFLVPHGTRRRRRFYNMNRDLATRYAHAATVFPDDYRSLMYQSDYFTSVRDHNPYDRLVKMFHPVGDLDMMAQMQYVDTQMYLPDDILVKVDKASMFNSLETRAPLLDQHLAEYVSSLPSAIRTRGNTLKYLLKKASANLVPPEILARPKKGFSVPIKHWFRGDLTNYARDLLDSPRANQRGIFKPQFVRSLLETHTHSKLMNYSSAIWALLCLELWFQAYMDQPPVLEAQSFGHEQSVHNQV